MNTDEDRSFDMLNASVIRLEQKVDDLSRKMSERDGERRFASWLMCTVSAMLGSGLGFFVQYLTRKGT
jgi:hypothetical protein